MIFTKTRILLFALILPFTLSTALSANTPDQPQENKARLNIIIKEVERKTTVFNKEKFIKKRELIREGLRIDPDNQTLLYHAALLNLDLERYQVSLNIINKLLQKYPKNPDYLKLKRIATEKLSETDATKKNLKLKLAKQPRNIETRLELISIEIQKHHYSHALASVNQGLAFSPNNKKLLYQKALLLMDISRYQQALDIANKLLKYEPNNSEYLELKKVASKKLSEAENDLILLKSQLKQQPNNVSIRLEIVNIEKQRREYKSAIAIVKQGLVLSPNDTQLLYANALLYIDIEEYAKAEKCLKKILEIEPNNKNALALRKIANKHKSKSTAGKTKKITTKKHIKAKEKTSARNLREAKLIRSTRQLSIALMPSTKKNAVILIGNPVYIDDKKQTWSYNSIIYARKAKSGDYLFYLNNRTRENKFAFQGAIEAFPTINKNLYLDLGYAYSDSFLFPEHTVIGRFAQMLGNNYELVSGGIYYRIVNFDLWRPELTIRKYFGHNLISISGIPFLSKVMKSLLLIQGTFRHYYNNNKSFCELVAGGGNAPDLLELTSSGFVNINTFYIYVKNETPIANNVYMGIQLGYGNDKFPSFHRNRYSLLVSLTSEF